MKHLLLLAIVAQTIASAFAGPSDVVPKKFKHGSSYVRVTKIGADKVKFEKCVKGYEQSSCQFLGPKKAYSLKELVKQRQVENREAAATITADVAIIAATVFTGGAIASGLFAGAAEMGSGIFFVDLAGKAVYAGAVGTGAVVGGYTGAAAMAFDPLNPVVQVNQARSLNTEVLCDELVVKGNIVEYIRNLETVLDKIK